MIDVSQTLKDLGHDLLMRSLTAPKIAQEMIDPFIDALYKMADMWEQMNVAYNLGLDKEVKQLRVEMKRDGAVSIPIKVEPMEEPTLEV